MGSCKKCYHYEVCRMHYQQKCELTYETEKEVRRAMLEAEKGNPICDHFKDRSRFVELPCVIISKALYNSAMTDLIELRDVMELEFISKGHIWTSAEYIRKTTAQILRTLEKAASIAELAEGGCLHR